MAQLRLAVICDYPEENWQSMDLCVQMLLKHLQAEHTASIHSTQVCPSFCWRFKQIPRIGKKHFAYNADRLLNRFWDYPRYLSQQVADFDLFHVTDHSYAQLVHVLPPERTGVFCHDIDAFRSLLEPEQEPRPSWYKAMSWRILQGLQLCKVVFYTTTEVRKQIEHYKLLDASRLVQAPLGIASEFSLTPEYVSIADQQILEQISEAPFLLHVGSCIPRKRIDILLEVFAQVSATHPLRLIKVSGEWTESQKQQITRLNIKKSIIHLQGLQRTTIAALYRRASAVLLTSEAEGFGLPLIEALACGAVVVASDIPVLREVGGTAAVYCPTEDVSAWVKTLEQLLANPTSVPVLNLRLAQAQKYSWSTHTQIIAQAYSTMSKNLTP